MDENIGERMPNPVLQPWIQLIPMIPVGEHSVVVTAETWQQSLHSCGLQNLHHMIFNGRQCVRLSRSRLLTYAYPNHEQKCVEVFMWGWPNRSRGTLRDMFLQNLQTIAAAASKGQPWPAYYERLHHIGGLGISTISKLAYFYGHQFAGMDSLILDQRIIEVLAAGRWQGLSMPNLNYANAPANYLTYLKTLSGMAGQLGCAPDQLEMLLFSWGNAF